MAFNNFHLIFLASLVAISLTLVIVGGSISAWCVKVGHGFECHSLFHSQENFSCLFKLFPTGVIFCLIISLLMFMILITIQAKKEYQIATRFINILVLSIAIILIMIVLLQWFHPPSHASKNIVIAIVSGKTANGSEQFVFSSISSKDPAYIQALETQQRSIATHRYNLNHGPNLFFASFVLLLCTLIVFIIMHQVKDFI